MDYAIGLCSALDFVSMNKDFQAFVTLVSNTISEQCNKEGPVSIPDLMKAKVTASTTLQDSLGDIISSIR